MQASGLAFHRVQCWRKGWWGWEAGNPLYCPDMSSLPETQTPGKKDRKKGRESVIEMVGGREGKGRTGEKKSRHGNSAMYRSNHLLDPQKKNMSALIEFTQLLKRKHRSTQPVFSHLNQLIWPYPSSADLSQSKAVLLHWQKKDKIVLPFLFTGQTAVSILQSAGGLLEISLC